MKQQLFTKICCISSVDEANAAIKAGASAIGLVSEMPSGPGVIDDRLVARIVDHVDERIETFLLTSRTEASAIIAHQKMCRASALQLVADVSLDALRTLKPYLPSVKLVKVIHIRDEASIATAQACAPFVDALLLDSFATHGSTPQLGGTGLVHDWSISRAIRESVGVPVILAGGLRETNVKQAVQRVSPFGVDICSGVRSNDMLNPQKLAMFMRVAQEVDLVE